MDIIDTALSRYSTKAFDPNKKISSEDLNSVKELLRLSPSSTNLQPWHFIFASSDEAKARVAKSTTGPYAFNEEKILKADHTIVFCSKTQVNDEYLNVLNSQENSDGRFKNSEEMQMQFQKRKYFADIHNDILNDASAWIEKQVYLNLGYFLLGVAALNIDAVPIEGFDIDVLDAEFDLAKQGLRSSVIVPIGYRSSDDFNAKLPKSRLALNEILTQY